ncbi:MAG: amidohydrolase [Alicyclobacillus macrosporangiidus]|uniref:amidohydrolase n=1 Tax=Alicyclobacillus macrosporangiidus TaxID=392015 RepID=UPI0026EAC4D5|nr:amidohydrolase [Alicyclobacillus macrosporangiidus]MCL6600428.1 amidohydrolase [Alicyclobacillus macrosporangiidus]
MPSLPEVHARIHEAVVQIRDDMVALSLDLHEHPELSLQEHYASGRLKAWLEREGFAVESPVAGLPTAFVGRIGQGRPTIAFLLEYDALPEIGHACGHNLIATGGLTAAISLARALPKPPGSIWVIGTPGEEGAGGKVIELEAGVFDGVDAALMFHLGDRTIPWRHATATAHLRIQFHGKAAHAAGSPQEGRNALAAMIQFFVSVDGLRQHIPESARLHGIITHGGAAPNIVPDFTEADLRGAEKQPHHGVTRVSVSFGIGRGDGRARPAGRDRVVRYRECQLGLAGHSPVPENRTPRHIWSFSRVSGGRPIAGGPTGHVADGRGDGKDRGRSLARSFLFAGRPRGVPNGGARFSLMTRPA